MNAPDRPTARDLVFEVLRPFIGRPLTEGTLSEMVAMVDAVTPPPAFLVSYDAQADRFTVKPLPPCL